MTSIVAYCSTRQLGRGEFNPATTKVLHLINNVGSGIVVGVAFFVSNILCVFDVHMDNFVRDLGVKFFPILVCTLLCYFHNSCLPVAGESSAKSAAVSRGTEKAQSEELAALTKQIASLEKREVRYNFVLKHLNSRLTVLELPS